MICIDCGHAYRPKGELVCPKCHKAVPWYIEAIRHLNTPPMRAHKNKGQSVGTIAYGRKKSSHHATQR